MVLRGAVLPLLAVLLCPSAPAAAHTPAAAQTTRATAGVAGPAVGPVAVRVRPGSVLQPDGRRQLLLTATSDTAMCSYTVWRGTYVGWPSPPSWSLLGQRTLSKPTTAFRFVDSTPALAASHSWYYRVQAQDCTGVVGPYTQVPERAYGVTDDPALALTGPTQVVAASASYGGSHQVASGTGAQVSFAIPEHYDVALYARPGPDGGVAAVVLDGVEIGSVSFYAAQSRPSTAVWVHRFSSDKGTGLLKFVLRSAGAGGGTALTFDALASTESVFHGA